MAIFAEYLFEASKSITIECYYELTVFIAALKYTFDHIGF